MDQRVLRVLEFDKIRAMLAEAAKSDMGREICKALVPEGSLAKIQGMQAETAEAETIHYRVGASPVPEFTDVRPALSRARIGAVLSMSELLEVARSLRAARQVRATLTKGDEAQSQPLLFQMAQGLMAYADLEEEISRCIVSAEEMADSASTELASIRRQIRLLGSRMREKLNGMLRSTQFQKYLQEPVITMRNDRYVLPVKQEYRPQVPGLVHDQSGSGQTLFIEPMAVVEIGNDLKQWHSQEQQEIERILMAFSARIEPEAGMLENNLHVLAKLDFVFCKAALSRRMRGVSPKLNDQGKLNIIRGRHPLIAEDKVVPISIWLGEDFTTLVVTGPNTGGKTVTLKTVGLFTLMAQAGLHVPAQQGTEMAVFKQVFADIGDEQSIEQSLSTFSSHMTNIVDILSRVQPGALTLFDELGAGTDPTEGAALAIAILNELLQFKIRTVATTHYSELKEFALTHPGVENASVEFNVETLSPTYRLSIGVPGKSNAFEISRRLGLSEGVIQRARETITQDQIRFEDVIANAEYHRQIAEKERALAEEARQETVRVRDALEAQQKKLEGQRQDIIGKAREEAKRILHSAREQMDQSLRAIKNLQSEDQAARDRVIQQQRDNIRSGISALGGEEKAASSHGGAPPENLRVGERVKVLTLDKEASVLSTLDAKGDVQVQVGIMKMNVSLADLRRIKGADAPKANIRPRELTLSVRSAALEVDVRGMDLAQAIESVDKFLDDAVLSGMSEVSIIHGKGTGTLRAGIQQHLKRHQHVQSYRLGKYGEGEAGVTMVTLL